MTTAFDLQSYLHDRRKKVNSFLAEILDNHSGSSIIIDAMKYSTMAGGKRLRPVLCIASAEAVKGKFEDVLPAACAVEMIHTYSLIHDDLPAMDNDNLRRGRPTSHVMFDEATAILSGDALLTLAFQILSSNGLTNNPDPSKWIDIIHFISLAAGSGGMIEGQMLDIASENKAFTLDKLEYMHSLKTGALIEAAIYAGATLGGGSAAEIKRLRSYAKNIGLAFQVRDDILNIEGDAAVMGKSVGTDKIRKKNTYPLILGIDKSREFAKNLVNKALHALDQFDEKSDPLRALANYIIARKR